MRALVVLMLGCGCRLGFDEHAASPDAGVTMVAHDEDGDGVDDASDGCPHLAGTQTDRDNDGVGDACDPNPDTPIDRIAMFDGFAHANAAWTWSGAAAPAFVGDALVVDTTGDRPLIGSLPATATGDDLYLVGGRVTNLGSGQQMIALGYVRGPVFPDLGTSTTSYYCELCAGGACGDVPFLSFTYTYNNSIFTHVDQQNLGALAPSNFVFTTRRTAGSVVCSTTLPANATSTGGVPATIAADVIGLNLKNLVIELHYFLHIRSS